MITMHMQRWAAHASELPRRPKSFWPRRTARRPAKKMGRRPSTSAENFRRTCPDICATSRELEWGTLPDVQRKCAPTSRENVPRRPEKMCPDVQRESTNVSRKMIFLIGRSLWTSGNFFSGRRGRFPPDVGTHFLWTSGGVAHPILWTSGRLFFGRRACVGGGPLFQAPLERLFGAFGRRANVAEVLHARSAIS